MTTSDGTPAPIARIRDVLRLGPGATVPLGRHQDRVWRIEEGSVEVYLQPGARRQFLAAFRAGALLFGGADPLAGLMALVPEMARLSLWTADELLTEAREPAKAEWIARTLDHWLLGLSTGILPEVPRRPAVRTAGAGETIEVSAGSSLAATGGIVWVTCPVGGRASFLDEIDLAPQACIPLSPATWIGVATDEALVTRGTRGRLAEASVLADLRAFHDLLGQLADRRARARAEAEGAALAASQNFTGESLSAALGRLDGLLVERRARSKRGDYEFVFAKTVPDLAVKTPLPPDVDLGQAAQILNIKVRDVVLSGRWWEQDIGRLATTRMSDKKPVALVTDWLGRYVCHCNEEPPRRVTASIAEDLDPQASSLLAPMPRRKVTAFDLLRISYKSTRRDFFILLLASAIVSLLGLVLPVAMGYVIDTFVPSHMWGDTIILGLFVATVTLASAIVHFCASIARQRMDGILEAEISGKVMERILHLPSRVLKSFSAADPARRVTSVDQVRRAVMSAGLDTMLTGLFGLSGLALLFVYSPSGGLMVLVLFVVLMSISVVTGLAQLRAVSVGNQMTANETSFRLQMIQNVSTLRAYAAERRAFSHWAMNFAETRARGLRSRLVTAAFRAFVALYPGLALAAVFVALGTKNSGGLSTGSYLAFLTAYQNFSFASLGVAQSVTQLIALQPTVKRAASVLAAEPEVTAGAKAPGGLSGALSVSRVSFSYSPDGPKILREIDFEVRAGEFVAICGSSGSGKSTLLNLLVGFDRPTAGAIHYDGKDLSQLDLAAVRRQIGLVRQTSRLFGGTIAENIIGAQRASLEDAWLAAQLAGIEGDIHRLPMGMHTMITEGVSTFSGGQLQRLMIARSLVARPKIVIFDEATSALDNITQSEVTRNIERLGATRILVAHRLSTVRNADRIFFLKDGRIVEQGSYDELMAADGLFANFGRRQMLTESHA